MIGSRVITIFVYIGLTRNPEIGNTPSAFCPISADCEELGIPDLTVMSLIINYRILQNARVTTFTISELLRENQQAR